MKKFFITHNLLEKEKILYLMSFILPGLIFFSYFFYTKNGVLTVDLGQQYVDFLAFFRHNLFTHPFNLIYTFSNGLGNSMLATDAYYLLSPFNLLLFVFPQHFLPKAILLIITLKIATAGLTSYYYWKQKINDFYALAASAAYALSGYVVSNHYNLMWLDSVLLLPLLIEAIDRVLNGKKNHLILITFLLWFTNFYTAFMALFFGLLYLLTQLFFINKDKRGAIFIEYLKRSVLGSFLDAFMLLPVFIEMLQGKATASAQWSLNFQFPPYEELAKLAAGAYNFHEMQEGMPSIYIALPFVLLTILYFLRKQITWQRKLANGLLLIFLIASLFWTPLVLLWHLGQFPVWYPGRVSVVLILFSLNLDNIALKKTEKIYIWQKGILAILAIGLIIFWLFNQKDFAFLTQDALIASGAFLALALLFISLIYRKHSLAAPFFYLVVELELIVNLVLSLGNLAYQKDADYQNFVQNTAQVTQYEKQIDDNLYRTEKTFYRSDDDPFSANYYGISNFNSISDQNVLKLLDNFGFLNNSNSYTNFGSTPITDDLFGIKYYILPNDDITPLKSNKQMKYDNSNHRIDVGDYLIQKRLNQLILMKNPDAASLLFLSPNKTKKIKFDPANITINQNKFFQAATGSKAQLFHNVIWPDSKKINVSSWDGGWMQYSKKKHNKESRVVFNFRPQTDDSYYIELPGEIDENTTNMYVNGQSINLDVRDQNTRLINLGSKQRGQRIQIVFTLKNNNLNLTSASIWRLNVQRLNHEMSIFNKKQPVIRQTSPLVIKSNTFTINKTMTMNSTIPNNFNWLVLDNGKIINKNKILFMNTFLNFSLSKGKHKITLVYIPWIFLVGILISLLTIIILLIIG